MCLWQFTSTNSKWVRQTVGPFECPLRASQPLLTNVLQKCWVDRCSTSDKSHFVGQCHECNSDQSMSMPKVRTNVWVWLASWLPNCSSALAGAVTGMSIRSRWRKSKTNPKGARYGRQESKVDLREQEQDGLESESDPKEMKLRWTEVWGGAQDKVEGERLEGNRKSNIKPKASKYTGGILKY